MPNVQTAYPLRQDAYVVGQPTSSRYRSDTGVVETAAGIGIAVPVARGTILTPFAGGGSRNDALVVMASGLTFLGISRRDQGRAATEAGIYPKGTPIAYFQSAEGVAVLADAAVNPGDTVRWNSATGRYTSAAASGTVFECTGWTFRSVATAAGQIVEISRF